MFNYLYYVAAGRILGVDAYGELSSISAAVLALSAPASVAQVVLARLAAEFQATRNTAALYRLARLAGRWTAGVSVAVLLVAVAARDALTGFFHAASPLPVLIGMLALALFALTTVQRGILQGTHRFGPLSVSFCLETGLRLAIGIPCAARFGVSGALAGLLGGVAVSTAYNALCIRAAVRNASSTATVPLQQLRRIVTNVGLVQFMLTLLYSSYDVALVRFFLDARAAGLYAAASLAGRAVIGALAFIPILVMPKATSAANRNAPVYPLLAAALAMGGAIAGVAALLTAAFPARVVAALAGSAFRDAGGIAALYVPAAGLLGIGGIVAAYQIGLHRYAFVVPASLVALAQIVAIVVWHPSPHAVASVLLASDAAFCAATFIGIGARTKAV